MTLAQTDSLAFKSAAFGVLPRCLTMTLPTVSVGEDSGEVEEKTGEGGVGVGVGVPMVVVDVVMKSIEPVEENVSGDENEVGGALVTYELKAVNASEEGLKMMLECAAREGVFTRAVCDVGFPSARVEPVMTARNVTPVGAVEGDITLEIQQVESVKLGGEWLALLLVEEQYNASK